MIETVHQSRKIGVKKETGGELHTPLFFEHKEIEKSRKGKNGIIVKKMGVEFIPIAKKELLSIKEDRIDVINVTVIQVKHSTYIEEKELFSEDSKLLGDRKGVYFLRDGIRCVGSAKQLGFKLHDRTQASVERQRMQVQFSSNSDEYVGSTFNKQMPEHALPCSVLNNALMNIYKQVANPWNKKWKTLDAASPKSDSDSDSDSESDEKNDSEESADENEQLHAAEPFQLNGSNEVVIPSAEPVAEEHMVEVLVVEEPIVEKPITEEPITEEPITEEPIVEEPITEEPITEVVAVEHVVEVPVAEEPIAEEPVVEESEAEELSEEEWPQFNDEVSEFEQFLTPRKNIIDLTPLSDERYKQFKEIAKTFGLDI